MRTGLLIAAIVALLSACAAPPRLMRYTKDGATQEGFMKDRYECLQEAQQRVSGAYVNQYGGGSNSQVICNRGIFVSCLGARGYVLDPDGALFPPPGMAVFCR